MKRGGISEEKRYDYSNCCIQCNKRDSNHMPEFIIAVVIMLINIGILIKCKQEKRRDIKMDERENGIKIKIKGYKKFIKKVRKMKKEMIQLEQVSRKTLQELIQIRKELQTIRNRMEPIQENYTLLNQKKSSDFSKRVKEWFS